MNSQPSAPLFRRLRPARPGSAPRPWLKLLRLVMLLFLAVDAPVQAVQTQCGLYVAPEGDNSQWTWSLDGVSMSGTYYWECGYAEYSSWNFNLDLKPNTPYLCKVAADSDICSAYAIIWPPSCYDLYVTDT